MSKLIFKSKKNICEVRWHYIHWLNDNEECKAFVSNRVTKIKGSFIIWKGNMFIRKKIQPILGVEVVKYVSWIINGGKVSYDSKIKHAGLSNQKFKIATNLIWKRKILKFWQLHELQKTCLIRCYQNSHFLKHQEY